ncbi:hypothetical protein CBOM_07439 [Ceraceosorus bombacis]|uniref:Uncharacterized protein n=1 Tax=Ceraceosorus bombacis TaxID=401625 RepID=A0A0P1BDB5_9BASI|nr:hypothetical protein CBOM_07439 [Ceraceosorus bombacis]
MVVQLIVIHITTCREEVWQRLRHQRLASSSPDRVGSKKSFFPSQQQHPSLTRVYAADREGNGPARHSAVPSIGFVEALLRFRRGAVRDSLSGYMACLASEFRARRGGDGCSKDLPSSSELL